MAEVNAVPVTSIDGGMSTDDGAHVLLKLGLSGRETVLAIARDQLHPLLTLVWAPQPLRGRDQDRQTTCGMSEFASLGP
jgi:hypothetical protein